MGLGVDFRFQGLSGVWSTLCRVSVLKSGPWDIGTESAGPDFRKDSWMLDRT